MKSSRIIHKSTCSIKAVLLNMPEIILKRQELITNPSNVISRIEDFVGVEPYLTEDKMGFQIRLQVRTGKDILSLDLIGQERYLAFDSSDTNLKIRPSLFMTKKKVFTAWK